METKLNIAEILKDKPQGTKLYSPICGECELSYVEPIESEPQISVESTMGFGVFYFWDDGKVYVEGKCLLYPSEKMQDWSKFAWKKGDLLTNSCGFQCIFKEWASDDYTRFNGCYSNSRDGYEDVSNAETAKFYKLDNNTAYGYVREIEKRFGGIFNLETLEIEKTQPEFKDGDILCVIDNFDDYHYILIYKSEDNTTIYRYVTMLEDNSLVMQKGAYLTKPEDYSVRLATEEEKKQLFSALAKKGKAWDADKKQIVDLKPKIELKPFDKVLVREEEYSEWQADFFSNIDEDNRFVCIGFTWSFCIPYNEETAKLIGTTNYAFSI